MLNWGAPGGPWASALRARGACSPTWPECSSLFFLRKANTYPPNLTTMQPLPLPSSLIHLTNRGVCHVPGIMLGAGNTGAECTANPQFLTHLYLRGEAESPGPEVAGGAQASLLSQPQPRSPGPTWTHSTPPPPQPQCWAPALGPGYLSRLAAHKEVAEELAGWAPGVSGHMKANWQSAGHQVALGCASGRAPSRSTWGAAGPWPLHQTHRVARRYRPACAALWAPCPGRLASGALSLGAHRLLG